MYRRKWPQDSTVSLKIRSITEMSSTSDSWTRFVLKSIEMFILYLTRWWTRFGNDVEEGVDDLFFLFPDFFLKPHEFVTSVSGTVFCITIGGNSERSTMKTPHVVKSRGQRWERLTLTTTRLWSVTLVPCSSPRIKVTWLRNQVSVCHDDKDTTGVSYLLCVEPLNVSTVSLSEFYFWHTHRETDPFLLPSPGGEFAETNLDFFHWHRPSFYYQVKSMSTTVTSSTRPQDYVLT